MFKLSEYHNFGRVAKQFWFMEWCCPSVRLFIVHLSTFWLTLKLTLQLAIPSLVVSPSNTFKLLILLFQEPMKSRAPQLHLEYRFYKQLGQAGIHNRIMQFSMICSYIIMMKISGVLSYRIWQNQLFVRPNIPLFDQTNYNTTGSVQVFCYS